MKILLIHQYAGNKGDRAVAYALCTLIKSIDSTIDITISTSSPALWENEEYYKRNNISFIGNSWSFPDSNRNWYWRIMNKIHKYTFTLMRTLYLVIGKNPVSRLFINPEFYNSVRTSDLIISVGGHHFTTLLSKDLVSSINYDAMSALSMGKSLICFSQTFGPFKFHNQKNYVLTKKILTESRLLLPRDSVSIKELENIGVPTTSIRQTFESVIALNGIIRHYIEPSNRLRRIGIAIYATRTKNYLPINEEQYIDTIVNTCKYWISAGYVVRFFPMELKGSGPDDRILIKKITSRLPETNSCVVYDEDMTTEQHIQEVAKCTFFIGHKTHSTIFAMATGTPLVGIAYHVKTREFMRQFDVEEYCIDDKDLTSDTLIRVSQALESNLDFIGNKLFNKATELSETIKRDMQLILSD